MCALILCWVHIYHSQNLRVQRIYAVYITRKSMRTTICLSPKPKIKTKKISLLHLFLVKSIHL